MKILIEVGLALHQYQKLLGRLDEDSSLAMMPVN